MVHFSWAHWQSARRPATRSVVMVVSVGRVRSTWVGGFGLVEILTPAASADTACPFCDLWQWKAMHLRGSVGSDWDSGQCLQRIHKDWPSIAQQSSRAQKSTVPRGMYRCVCSRWVVSHTRTHKRHMDSYLLLDVEASALPHSLEFNPVTLHFAAEPGSLLHAVDEIPSC